MPTKSPHHRPDRLQLADGRRSEAKYMNHVRTALVQHVGGNPSAMQSMIIDQCVILSLRIRLMDLQFLKCWETSQENSQDYLAWVNALSRMFAHLGINAPADANAYDAHRAAAALAAVPLDERSAIEIRAEARRLANGESA